MNEIPLVLIIEDDPFYSKISKTKLTKEGIAVKVVDNGDDALNVLAEQKPNLILLDLIMPGKSGFEILEEIKRNPLWKDIPVLVISNMSEPEDIRRIMDLGALDYLVKANVPIQEVTDKVKYHLQALHHIAS
jgi:CheY-like chemotaxis protein